MEVEKDRELVIVCEGGAAFIFLEAIESWRGGSICSSGEY
jgi:hypothetical protein